MFSILVITGCGAQTIETTETEPDGGAVALTTEAPVQPEPEPTVEAPMVSGDVRFKTSEEYEIKASFGLSMGR